MKGNTDKVVIIASLAVMALVISIISCAADAERTFIVSEGAAPWFDRIGQWSLANVPDELKGTGPLPQGDCSSRSLEVPGKPTSITVGVQANDVAKFSEKFPGAKDVGLGIAVKNPAGITLPYSIFTLADPPEKLEGAGVFGAGLLLLKVEGGESALSISPAEPAQPSASPEPPASPEASASAGSSASPQAAAGGPKAFQLGAKDHLHLYLLIGQSNMVGRDTTGIDSQTDNPNIGYLGGGGDSWFIAREPMHAGGSGIGPGIPFAQEMLKADHGIKIGLIPCAVGGTPLSRWVKGGDLYESALGRARAAMKAGKLKGVLWHQGESDSNARDLAESYEARLTQMFRDLRADLGMPDLPIVVGQLGDFVQGSYVAKVRASIAHLPADLPRVGFADSAGLKDKGDQLHFSTTAARELGHRFAAAIRKIQETPGS